MKVAASLSAASAALALALMPALAWAGGKAVVESGDGSSNQVRSSIEYDGKGALRMDVADQPGNYMLVRDGKVYSVVSQDGQPVVMDLGAMMKMMGGMAQQMAAQQPMAGSRDVVEFVSLSATGGSESVAGVDGRVYQLTYVDGNGQRQTETVVLSADARAHELTQAMFTMSTTMAQTMQIALPSGGQRLQSEIAGGKQGILRYGSQFRVLSFDGGSPAASRFALPAEPVQMPGLGGMLSGGVQADAELEASAQDTGAVGDIVGEKAERQQQRVEDRANQEVDQATDSAVDKVLDKAFDKLFGR
jgi:hypothetical protein